MKTLIAEPHKSHILRLLSEKELSGYEIVKNLEKEIDGRLPWKHGNLYPLLKKMEKEKLIVGQWEKAGDGRSRRYYKLKSRKSLFDKIFRHWMNLKGWF
ncbi:MAG TPA: PadR family transcriptional regulator [Draconibacterium sp.]|nr:PadR family transcriptional regulator [Draconibacterium sp.]